MEERDEGLGLEPRDEGLGLEPRSAFIRMRPDPAPLFSTATRTSAPRRLVKYHPGGLVARQTELPLYASVGHAAFVGADHIGPRTSGGRGILVL